MSDTLSALGLTPAPENRDDATPAVPGAPETPEPTPAAEPAPEPTPVVELTPAESAVVAQAEKPDAVKALIEAERKKARDAYAKARDLEQREQERLEASKPIEERLADVTKRAETEALKNIKLTIGVSKGLPLDLCDRLTGATVDEISADAEKLLGAVKTPAAPTTPAPAGGMNGGFQTPPPAETDPNKQHNSFVLSLLGRTQQ